MLARPLQPAIETPACNSQAMREFAAELAFEQRSQHGRHQPAQNDPARQAVLRIQRAGAACAMPRRIACLPAARTGWRFQQVMHMGGRFMREQSL